MAEEPTVKEGETDGSATGVSKKVAAVIKAQVAEEGMAPIKTS